VYLLIDVGNTAVKWIITPSNQFEVLEEKKFPVGEKTWVKSLLEDYQNYRPLKVAYSSVKPSVDKVFKEIFPLAEKATVEKLEPLIGIDYETKHTLGVDRVLNALGGLEYGNTFAVVSLGTATVVDLTLDKTFKGGFIFCGLQKQMDCLLQNTELIKVSDFSQTPPTLGKNTSQAVWGGIFYSTLFGIKEICNLWREKFGIDTLIITGGFSNLLERHLRKYLNNWKVIKDVYLTLKGLKRWLDRLN